MIRHLYVHVPFCLRRCSYCDFAVTATPQAPVAEWVTAINRELDLVIARESLAAPQLDTLYIGGGTPSLIGGAGMHAFAQELRRRVLLNDDYEWTVEANPETFTSDVADEWARTGVNRISLGAQTFNEEVLRWMGRMHGADGPPRALAAARAAGISNVSIDLIFALPARFQRDWRDDLERVLALEPMHVSLYGLTAETGTPLGRWVAEGREQLADEDAYAEQYLLAARMLTAAGFVHYEVSNFARPGFESRHNQAYWNGSAYLGLGPGAHSLLPPERRWNVRDWHDYRERVGRGELPREGCEHVDLNKAGLEDAWLGLRTNKGVPIQRLSDRQTALARDWARRGWGEEREAAFRLTAEGWLLLDRLSVELASA
ncbi:MAG TPA: radical SAM family heme chaperone HemW [Longimicrobiales bacterium]